MPDENYVPIPQTGQELDSSDARFFDEIPTHVFTREENDRLQALENKGLKDAFDLFIEGKIKLTDTDQGFEWVSPQPLQRSETTD
jgi:hypothetical protein